MGRPNKESCWDLADLWLIFGLWAHHNVIPKFKHAAARAAFILLISSLDFWQMLRFVFLSPTSAVSQLVATSW